MNKYVIYLAAVVPLLIATGRCEQGGSVIGYLLSVTLICAVAWLAAQYVEWRILESIRRERAERLKAQALGGDGHDR